MKKTLLREQEREEVTVELATEETEVEEVEEVVEEKPKKKSWKSRIKLKEDE